MLYDGNQTVGTYSRVNLNTYSVLCRTPKLFNLQMLLEPLEKELNLPSVLIKFSYLKSGYVHRICDENELTFLFFIPIPDDTKLLRIVLFGVVPSQFNDSV